MGLAASKRRLIGRIEFDNAYLGGERCGDKAGVHNEKFRTGKALIGNVKTALTAPLTRHQVRRKCCSAATSRRCSSAPADATACVHAQRPAAHDGHDTKEARTRVQAS